MTIPRYLGFVLITLLCSGKVLAERPTSIQQPATVFTQPGCAECKKAMEFLERENRQYKEIDITQSERSYQVFESLGGIGTPFTLYSNYQLHGFDTELWQDIFSPEKDQKSE